MVALRLVARKLADVDQIRRSGCELRPGHRHFVLELKDSFVEDGDSCLEAGASCFIYRTLKLHREIVPSIADVRELVRELPSARYERLHVRFGAGNGERLSLAVSASDGDRSRRRHRWLGNGDYYLRLILGLHSL